MMVMLTENIGEILKLIFVAAILDVQTGHIRVSLVVSHGDDLCQV